MDLLCSLTLIRFRSEIYCMILLVILRLSWEEYSFWWSD